MYIIDLIDFCLYSPGFSATHRQAAHPQTYARKQGRSALLYLQTSMSHGVEYQDQPIWEACKVIPWLHLIHCLLCWIPFRGMLTAHLWGKEMISLQLHLLPPSQSHSHNSNLFQLQTLWNKVLSLYWQKADMASSPDRDRNGLYSDFQVKQDSLHPAVPECKRKNVYLMNCQAYPSMKNQTLSLQIFMIHRISRIVLTQSR